MKQSNIPHYRDPYDFQSDSPKKYPCDTQNMKYNVLTHKYYLTNEALLAFGVDVESGYMLDAPNKIMQFIEEVTEDIYGIMMDVAPYNFMHNCYLVAQSRCLQFDRYSARKQFEKALLYQAAYKIEILDPRKVTGIDHENGNNIYFKTLRKEFRHISQQTLDILKSLGLLFNGNIHGKHLINYKELM